MNNASWNKRPSDQDAFYHHETDYPHANILGPSATKSRRRLNYSTWFAIVTLAIYGLSWLLFH